jgi:hypothetical protein
VIRVRLRLRGLALLGALLGFALAAVPAAAEGTEPPPVELDRLLKLPDNMEFDVERRGGATRSEWRTRFEDSRLAVRMAQEDLAKSQQELEEAMAGSPSWSLAPPGMPAGGAEGGSYQLKQEVRRSREELERATRRLQDLIVEANLAGVPEEWRQ